jgi:hypothetical protein
MTTSTAAKSGRPRAAVDSSVTLSADQFCDRYAGRVYQFARIHPGGGRGASRTRDPYLPSRLSQVRVACAARRQETPVQDAVGRRRRRWSSLRHRAKRAMLHHMEARGHGSLHATGQGGVWRRPPLTIPRSRRPSFWRSPKARLRNVAPGMAIAAGWGAPAVRGFVEIGWPIMAILTVALVAWPFGYGVALLATCRHGARRVPTPMGDNITVGARVWLGLALALPAVLGGIGAALFDDSPTVQDRGWFMFFFFAPVVVAVGCLLVAYALSIRPLKASIVAGLAPTFVTSPDHLWWWDGAQWFGVSSVAPPHALRSPDGNYWWTGDHWNPTPALPARKPRRSPSASLA